TTPVTHTAPRPVQVRTAVAHSSRPTAKRPRRPRRHQRAETRPSRADPSGWIVPLPSRRPGADAAGSRGSQEVLRAAIALFLVALAEGSLLLRLSAQLPRRT